MPFGDLTGNTKIELQQQVLEEQAIKAQSMAMATAALEAEKNEEAVDLTPIPAVEIESDGEIELVSVDESEKVVEFKVNATLENVTIGYGNHYNFEQGRKYKAPQSVYDYLEEKGLIWH